MDNRPLTLAEFEKTLHQVVYVSATPADYEIKQSNGIIVEQVIRPTGLLDPVVTLQPTQHQIDHLVAAIKERTAKNERVLVTTLTKRMAEELTKYLERMDIRCRYIHSEIKTLDRVSILEELRQGKCDVLVGVNLLREGLDLPEVSLVAILDADKEGFLRNFRSLIQNIGRAARHINGKVIMYADKITPSIQQAMQETNTRRNKQMAYNKKHAITPKPVTKANNKLAKATDAMEHPLPQKHHDIAEEASSARYLSTPEIKKIIRQQKRKIEKAALAMDYIKAQALQDEITALEKILAQKTNTS